MKSKIREFLDDIAFLVKVTLTAILVALIVGLLVTALILGGMELIKRVAQLRLAELPPDTPSEGVAWIMPESGEAAVWLSPVCGDEAETARMLDEYTEGDSPVPLWWNPDEPMAAEWVDGNALQSDSVDYNAHPPIGIDTGGVDWNLCTSLIGWDGHMAEIWEIDLFTRVFYLEFWQPDVMLCEAGCDAILRLWESGEKGRTLGEVLSSKSEDGDWTYSVYPQVWETNYDADGLAWCRQLCEERFYKGPEWIAPYFRLDHYHDWAIPAYQIGNVYFSVGVGGGGIE